MRVLITGGTSGIGRAVALLLGSKGHNVDVVGGTNKKKGESLKREFESLSGSITFYPVDLSDGKIIKSFAQEYVETSERLDVLFLNAGVFPKTRNLNEDQLDRSFIVNYLHKFMFTILLNPLLKKSQGKILMNGAMSFVRSLDLSKENFGMQLGTEAGMQTSYALSYVTYWQNRKFNTGVPIMGMSPGYVKTGSTETMHWLLRFFLRPFMILPEEAAKKIVYLMEEELTVENSGAFFNGSKKSKFGKSVTSKEEIFEHLWDLSLKVSALETPPEWNSTK